MYVFFTKQTIVKSIKVLVPFQDAEETCKICKTDFSDDRNKITLGERVVGGEGGGSVRINYASVQRGEDLQAKTGDHVRAHSRRVYTNKSVTAVKLMKIAIVSPSKKRRSQRCVFCGHQEEILKKGAKKR